MHSFDVYCLHTKCIFHLYTCKTDELKTLNNTYWKKKKKTLKIIIEISEYGYSIDKTLFLKWIPHFKHLTDIASKKKKKKL